MFKRAGRRRLWLLLSLCFVVCLLFCFFFLGGVLRHLLMNIILSCFTQIWKHNSHTNIIYLFICFNESLGLMYCSFLKGALHFLTHIVYIISRDKNWGRQQRELWGLKESESEICRHFKKSETLDLRPVFVKRSLDGSLKFQLQMIQKMCSVWSFPF